MDFVNLNSIFKKTDLGTNALKVRNPLLTQKSRVLLILIDGKKTVSELAPSFTDGSDTHEKFKELLLAGFIAELLQQEASASQGETTSTQNVASKDESINPTISLQTAVRTATRMLADLLGPNSDVLCIQLEKCKTKDEYNTKILAFRKIIGTMRSEKVGDEFVKAAIL